jgi:hypothetical protein
MGHQPVAKPLLTQKTQTQNKRTQTSTPWVEFEITIPAFERAKTVHALHRAATVIACLHGIVLYYLSKCRTLTSTFTFLRNVCCLSPDYAVFYPRRQKSFCSWLWEFQIQQPWSSFWEYAVSSWQVSFSCEAGVPIWVTRRALLFTQRRCSPYYRELYIRSGMWNDPTRN